MYAAKLHPAKRQAGQARSVRPVRRRLSLAAWIALAPMAATVLFAYLGTMVWTARVSLSNSRTFPSGDFAGFTQYTRLFHNDRWLLSLQNIVI